MDTIRVKVDGVSKIFPDVEKVFFETLNGEWAEYSQDRSTATQEIEVVDSGTFTFNEEATTFEIPHEVHAAPHFYFIRFENAPTLWNFYYKGLPQGNYPDGDTFYGQYKEGSSYITFIWNGRTQPTDEKLTAFAIPSQKFPSGTKAHWFAIRFKEGL